MKLPEASNCGTPLWLRLSEGLGPLPEADGTAEANKERHPEGGYTFDEIPAWSERLVRAYAAEQVAAERERCAALSLRPPGWLSDSHQALATEIRTAILGNAGRIQGPNVRAKRADTAPAMPE